MGICAGVLRAGGNRFVRLRLSHWCERRVGGAD